MPLTLAQLETKVLAIEAALANTVTWYEYFESMPEAERLLHFEALAKYFGVTIVTDPVTGKLTGLKTGTEQIFVET